MPGLRGETESRRLLRIREELLDRVGGGERERVEDLPEWCLTVGTTIGQTVSIVLGGDGVRVGGMRKLEEREGERLLGGSWVQMHCCGSLEFHVLRPGGKIRPLFLSISSNDTRKMSPPNPYLPVEMGLMRLKRPAGIFHP